MIVFRMHGISQDAFDSSGAFFQPGRWHSAGTRVVYAAEHASLAALETLIHAGGKKMPPRAITRIHIPGDLAVESAPWMEMPASQAFGDTWVREARTAVLRVPSIAVNQMESNFVFNPSHAEFNLVQRDSSERFVFDPRFFLIKL
jgi:RES domain-containing protein